MLYYLNTFLFLISVFTISNAQLDAKQFKHIKPTEDYANVHVAPVYADVNASVYIIYIKKFVPKHVHEFHTEIVTILEGKARMFMDGNIFKIKKGDQIIIPQGTAHSVIIDSKKPLKVVSVQTPKFYGEDRVFLEDPADGPSKDFQK
ncbi:MAG: cupin domain-containing protein [Saprospiraceae bacterium]|nr:cupin domain-containing protein [Saprospiraceae bacterium]